MGTPNYHQYSQYVLILKLKPLKTRRVWLPFENRLASSCLSHVTFLCGRDLTQVGCWELCLSNEGNAWPLPIAKLENHFLRKMLNALTLF